LCDLVQRRDISVSLNLTFLGGAGTVTGSKFAVDDGSQTVLVDCGLFQGFKNLRQRNWAPFPLPLQRISAVVLTHAHLDHTGYLPLLVKRGYRGPVYCTQPTADLCEILLPDAGHLQEKDAEYANRHGFSKHRPALPLFNEEDARAALTRLRPVAFDEPARLPNGAVVHFRHAGHILGAASVQLEWAGQTLAFSGDVGRYGDPVMLDPEPFARADYLLVESTYGDRQHDGQEPQETLGRYIETTVARGGTVVIPAFAVGRAQSLLYHIERLKSAGRLKNVPIYLDSPMAIDASEIFCRHVGHHRLTEAECRRACGVAQYVRAVDASKALTNDNAMPKVIISASGMATGGRVLHHLKRYAPDPRNLVLFAGFQAGGTRGAAMVAGSKSIKIHGEYIPVAAEVANLSMLSGHADANEILRWLRGFRDPPRETFITHGEPSASDALRRKIEEELGWSCTVAEHAQNVKLA
jgi:metallo-beta-lactamase family protein